MSAASPAGREGYSDSKRRSRTRVRALVGSGVLLVAAVAATSLRTPSRAQEWIDEGIAALQSGNPAEARELANRALREVPDSPSALLLAARASKQMRQFTPAIGYYDRIPDDGTAAAVSARTESGQVRLTELGELSAAEQQFRRALKQDGDSIDAHAGLAYVLGMTSRPLQAELERLELIRLEAADTAQMYLLATGGAAVENPQQLQACAEMSPDDPAVKLGTARIAIELGDFDRAAELLGELAETQPDSHEVQVLLGELWLRSNADEEFRNWSRRITEAAAGHPGIWFVRGQYAERQGLTEAAVRCYGECVLRAPCFPSGAYRLGQSLVSLDETESAAPFLERAGLLADYAKQAELAYRVGEPVHFGRCMELAESLGLTWEAYGWARAAIVEFGPAAVPKARVERLRSATMHSPIARSTTGDEFPNLDLARYPLPDWSDFGPLPEAPPTVAALNAVSFRNDAAPAGLDFQYLNGGAPLRHGIVHMYEVVGGGVAVIDYDSDGWPDVYLPQGGEWPDSADPRALDELFRNRGDGTFQRVQRDCMLEENSFSQGAAVGDFDGDGFADVYVANIGANRLYRNNGDGTFEDVTVAASVGDERYSTSATIADFTGDALPEIFSLNYLSGHDLFERVCGDAAIPRSCLPQSFRGSPPRLYQNLGDGGFADASNASGLTAAAPGRGLGLIAGDLDGAGGLDVYVANDVGPNSLWIGIPSDGGEAAFRDDGLIRGVALNRDGDYESGMGIAAGDVDLDGRLDLLVTNFDDQTNTLYCQEEGGHFVDASATAGFAPKRHAYVGWGAQFFDAELDGLPDLMLTNGHVNDLRDRGQAYQMPAQFFSNTGDRRFVEREADHLGPFFTERHLGRGMARIDWNRDGREDILITHLDAPLALLTNTSPPAGQAFRCRLVGVQSARDPVGATVRVTVEGRTWTRQWLAGDGNQSSNERILVFATGNGATIESVDVHWPSGQVDRHHDLPTACDAVFVEGLSRWLELPR